MGPGIMRLRLSVAMINLGREPTRKEYLGLAYVNYVPPICVALLNIEFGSHLSILYGQLCASIEPARVTIGLDSCQVAWLRCCNLLMFQGQMKASAGLELCTFF